MKKCTKCQELKDESEFYFKNKAAGKRQANCKACQKLYTSRHYKKNRKSYIDRTVARKKRVHKEVTAFLRKYLRDHPCVDCGETDIVVLEFDHVRGLKENNIGTLLCEGFSLDRVKAEIKKCEVRCKNCHARKTAKSRGWWRLSSESWQGYH